jgi:transcriptional regulator with XRE-family HTH domain
MSISKVPGEAIRKIRHYKSYMQKEAAHRLGITQQAYSLLERSVSIKCKTVCNILEAFDCTPQDFEKINGYPPPPKSPNK